MIHETQVVNSDADGTGLEAAIAKGYAEGWSVVQVVWLSGGNADLISKAWSAFFRRPMNPQPTENRLYEELRYHHGWCGHCGNKRADHYLGYCPLDYVD